MPKVSNFDSICTFYSTDPYLSQTQNSDISESAADEYFPTTSISFLETVSSDPIAENTGI